MDSLLDRSLDRSLDEARRGSIAYLLDQNLLLASQYEPGGWLYENHSRDSGATVVNENGNVVWAPENLLDASEGSTVYWARTGVTHVLTGETYEGRVVHELTKTSAAGVGGYVRDHGQNGTLSENYRLYLSAKFEKTESPLIASIGFTNQGIASYYVAIDTLDGTVTGTNGTGGNHEVIDDGDWWLVRTPVSNYGGTGDDFFSIRFDPSEDVGAVLRFTQPMVSRGGFHDYLPTTGGNPTFAPRLQHDSAGNPLGYLHEPQATKKAISSYPGDHIAWALLGGESATSLVGLKTYEWIADTTTGFHWIITGSFAAVAGTTYARSFFAKAGDYRYVGMWSTRTGSTVVFDLQDGTVARATAPAAGEMEEYKDGVYRCVFLQAAIVDASLGASIWFSNDPNSNYNDSYAGDGTSIGYIAGFNAEEGRATSFLPNDGSGEITRQADTAEIDVPADSDGFAYVTYGDGGETTFAVTPGGTWTIPTDLDDTYSRIIFKR